MSSQGLRIVVFMAVFYSAVSLNAQIRRTGTVSYISNTHIYVRFSELRGLELGDTLFKEEIPVLIVSKKSSISTINLRLDTSQLQLGDTIWYWEKTGLNPNEIEKARNGKNQVIQFSDTAKTKTKTKEIPSKIWDWKGNISGSIRNNQTLVSEKNRNTSRILGRYSVQGTTQSLKFPTRVSLMGNYQQYTSSFSDKNYPQLGRLYIFQAHVNTAIHSNLNVQLGRGFQNGFSSLGAIDALSARYKSGGLGVTATMGFAPNIRTYGMDLNRPTVGAAADYSGYSKYAQWSLGLAWFDQYYQAKIDRRLMVMQGSLSLDKAHVFYVLESDLTRGIRQHRWQSVFISSRYQISPKLRIFASYDTRYPWIFWNSYDQVSIENLMDRELQRGLRFRLQYRSGKNSTWGLHATYRGSQTQSNMILGGMNYNRRNLFVKGSSVSYRISIADYGHWQNAQQLLRWRQSIRKTDFSMFYRNVVFARRYSSVGVFQQSYIGMSSGIPLKNRMEFEAFAEYDLQQQQQQLLIYFTLNKRF